jgi:hypothetical protein
VGPGNALTYVRHPLAIGADHGGIDRFQHQVVVDAEATLGGKTAPWNDDDQKRDRQRHHGDFPQPTDCSLSVGRDFKFYRPCSFPISADEMPAMAN